MEFENALCPVFQKVEIAAVMGVIHFLKLVGGGKDFFCGLDPFLFCFFLLGGQLFAGLSLSLDFQIFSLQIAYEDIAKNALSRNEQKKDTGGNNQGFG